jgi:nicotinamidase-related amidase/8-oxo-dGTP pyrophosphatase MutT (NUDIX family)
MQVFHAIWLVDAEGNHPAPYTLVSAEDVDSAAGGRTPRSPRRSASTPTTPRATSATPHALAGGGKYDLTIWPYHAMLGGIGHALVSAVEEAIFFHAIARHSHPEFQVKGDNPLTEHYSMLGPEVMEGPTASARRRTRRSSRSCSSFDAVVVAGQAKSHCMAWTIDDLLEDETVRRAARRAHLPARGLHVAGGRAGRRRLHRRGRRRLRALRGGRHARGAVDDPDRTMADLSRLLLTPEEAAEMDAPGTKDAAVLVPLYGDPLSRSSPSGASDLRRHAGEISFPGGRQDEPDEDCARRLCGSHEEIGLDPRQRRARGRVATSRHLRDRLPRLSVRVDCGARSVWRPQASEVAQVLEFHARPPAGGSRDATPLRKGVPIKTPTTRSTGTLSGERQPEILQSLFERLEPVL